MSRRIDEAVAELTQVFRTSATKHEANERIVPVMEQLTRSPAFLTEVIASYVARPIAFNRKNYPVVAMEIAVNPWFGLVANCWIPLPDRATHISTKAIHHHGNMLLTTATLFGPGYEHWMFTKPEETAGDRYSMKLIECAPHPQHHVSFVDAWIAHTPFYPKSLSITLALWSNRFPTTWRDRLKRLPGVKGNEDVLRKVMTKAGLRKALDLKVIDSFDFYPAPASAGFEVMRQRKEFELGPNEDHVHSVFHIVQETGNAHLSRDIRRALDAGTITTGRPVVEKLLVDLDRDRPIEGRLSTGHYDLPFANFTRDDVTRALRSESKETHGRKFAAAASGQEAARTRPD